MFFRRRKRYNGDVAALLPAFGIAMEEAGAWKMLNVLDIAWAQRFTVYEAALMVAYTFAGGLYKRGERDRANALVEEKLYPIQEDWVHKGIVRTEVVKEWPAILAKRSNNCES